jgi:hypothetical protein
MMSKYKYFLISFLVSVSLLIIPVQKAHAIDSKAKVLISTSVYGAAGGALLGFASMAFGTTSRSIAKGASLGLYAGMIFGAYVVASHIYRPPMEAPYEGSDSPYENNGEGSVRYDQSEGEETSKLFERAFEVNRLNTLDKRRNTPSMYLDVLRFEF